MTLIANQSLAQVQAAQNLSANLAALFKTQPELIQWVTGQTLHMEWVFGRDRTLTAIDEFGQWWTGCSLPTLAAEETLKKLQIKGAVGCFLAPPHAAHLRVTLDRLRPEQAIVAIVPEYRDLAVLLHCENLTEAIQSHRLWFAAGPAWEVGLRSLFDCNVGLATPAQFIRTPDADTQIVQSMITTAQQIFADVSSARSARLQALAAQRNATRTNQPRLCVVAPSRFRLWNDLGHTMTRIFETDARIETIPFDADDPLSSSPLALASALMQCNAILTANTARSDLPGLVPDSYPWLTWLTAGRIPSRALASSDDHLLAADSRLAQLALQSGWPKDRVHLAGWPMQAVATAGRETSRIGLIADTFPLDTPEDLEEYSSHNILWEAIRSELSADPFKLSDPASYLRDRMRQAHVGEDAFPTARFIDRLIVPAYQQGIARFLLRSGVPLRLYGKGWQEMGEFAPHADGEVRSWEELVEIASNACALLHAWPVNASHPIDSIAVPLIRTLGTRKDALLQQVQLALRHSLPARTVAEPMLSARLVLEILRSTSALRPDTISP